MTVAPAVAEARVDSFPLALKLVLVPEIYARYVVVRWLVRRLDLPTALARLREAQVPDGTAVDPQLRLARGIRLGHAVTKALAPLPADTRCLMRSLVLLSMLASRGIETTLLIAARSGPEFGAHAWIELDGTPLLTAEDPGYLRLTEL